MKNLPDKLSDLMELALADLAAVEADPRYEVDMSHWHMSGSADGKVCSVCFAGSVMAKSLDAVHGNLIVPNTFGRLASMKLNALDIVRSGHISGALGYLHNYTYEEEYALIHLNRVVADYTPGQGPWRASMDEIISDLRKKGL